MPTAITIRKPSPRRGGICDKPQYYEVTAGQTFVIGDWVYLVSNKLSIAAAASNDVGNITLAGRALANAADVLAGTAGNLVNGVWQCPVELPADDSEYLFPIYHSTGASAVTAISDVGTTLPLRNQAGAWVLNKETDGTNDRFVITELSAEHPVGETYGHVWARPLEANKLGA